MRATLPVAGPRLGDPTCATVVALLLAATLSAAPTFACTGDCNADGTVGADELVRSVRIALGIQPIGTCAACDPNLDGTVSVDEVVGAVESAVDGCPEGEMTLVLDKLGPALLAIAGTSASDVYVVGADPGDGIGPYVLHYDGQRWRRLSTGTNGSDLWWISVTPIAGAFYMVGENGLILRYVLPAVPGQTGTFEKQTPPGTALLYGVWGDDADNLWAVGGDPESPGTGGVIWHYDGVIWTALDTDPIRPGGLPTLFKVWGRSAGEAYAVGREGMILRFNGVRWTPVGTPLNRDLLGVHGNDSIVAAVGGSVDDAYLVELDNGAFVERTPADAMQLNGVFIPPDGKGVAVGKLGSVVTRVDDVWQNLSPTIDTPRDFHATWIDPEGGVWAVGGNLNDVNAGLLAYGGHRTIGTEIIDIDPCPPGTSGGPTTVSYMRDIEPIFQASCRTSNCHGGPFPSAAYDMRSYDGLFGPGSTAKSLGVCDLVPGNVEASFLMEALGPSPRGSVRQMPVNGTPLTEDQMQLVRTWILEGAQDDSAPTPTRTATRRVTPSPSRTPTQTRTAGTQTVAPTSTPTLNTTPAVVCSEPGVICTMAGTGASLFDGDGKAALGTAFYWPIHIAFDRDDRPLILDWNNLRLRRINADGRVQTLMGDGFERPPVEGALASETSLHHSSDAEFDADGHLYIAGYHVPYVFRVETDNRVTIVAGSGEVGNSGDGGSGLDARLTSPYAVSPTADGGVYISDIDAHALRFVDAEGVISTVAGRAGEIKSGYEGDDGPGTAALLSNPAGMALDGEGNLYFSDKGNHVIRRVDAGGTITTIAGSGQPGYIDNVPAKQARFESPRGLLLGPQGELYIADSGNSVIRRLRNGMVTTVVGSGVEGFGGDGGSARNCALRQPLGMSLARDGSLWIADSFNNRVRRVAGFLDSSD